MRLAGLSDRRQQVNRLQSIFGIDPSEVVIAGEPADLEQLEADAIDAWSRGTQIGEIRVERFEDDKLLDRQDYQIVPVEKMAWLINGKPDQPGSTLASPVTSRVLTEVVDTGLFPE